LPLRIDVVDPGGARAAPGRYELVRLGDGLGVYDWRPGQSAMGAGSVAHASISDPEQIRAAEAGRRRG
jgi:hypothetical protein